MTWQGPPLTSCWPPTPLGWSVLNRERGYYLEWWPSTPSGRQDHLGEVSWTHREDIILEWRPSTSPGRQDHLGEVSWTRREDIILEWRPCTPPCRRKDHLVVLDKGRIISDWLASTPPCRPHHLGEVSWTVREDIILEWRPCTYPSRQDHLDEVVLNMSGT